MAIPPPLPPLPPPPPPPPPADVKRRRKDPGEDTPAQRLYERAWTVDGIKSLLGTVGEIANLMLPNFAASIRVAVWGGPSADIRRIWYLTLATLFGRYRNRVRGAATIIFRGSWDISGKMCEAEVAYTVQNMLAAAQDGGVALAKWWDGGGYSSVKAFRAELGLGAGRIVAAADRTDAVAFNHRGPEQLTVGGPLPEWMQRSTALRTVRNAPPNTPWVGRPCLSGVLAKLVRMPVGPTGIRRPVGGVIREWPVGNNHTFPYSVQDSGGRNTNPLQVTQDGEGDLGLPDDGRIITTAEKNDPIVQAPQNGTDYGQSSLIALVAQALAEPCFLPATPPCTQVPTPPGAGMRVYSPGNVVGATPVLFDTLIQPFRSAFGSRVVLPDPRGGGSDGVVPVPASMPSMVETAFDCAAYPPPPKPRTPPPKPRTPPPKPTYYPPGIP